MINGLSIGNVVELDFLPNSTKILVTLKVKDKLKFSSKSIAAIYETGVLGGLAIAIEPIFDNQNVVKSGDTLNSSVRPGLTELINRQIEPLSRQLQSTITSFDSIFSGASYVFNKQTQDEIKVSIKALTSAVKSIDISSKILENTLTQKNSQINNSIDNIESITNDISIFSKELNNSGISYTLQNLSKSVNNLNEILLNINSENSSLGKLIYQDDIYNNLNLSIESLNSLIKDVSSNPKKYVHFSIFGRK